MAVGGDIHMMFDDLTVSLAREADLYARYGNDLTRFATGLVGPFDAEDVVGDAMVRFLKKGNLPGASNPRALMYRAVLASARSWQRSMFRRRRRELRTAERIESHDPEIRPDVVKAVLGLSPQQRACVFLAYWEDMAVVDIADLLGIDTGTVKQHLHRARRRLKEVLDD